ncbi:hypothetical protein QTP86_005696 [Hemibagrus guttatus]|nr:hypothetical protein QTP86_005696 [Hemibagrus guttatus]
METPGHYTSAGGRGRRGHADEPVFKVPNKRKKQGKGQGKKQAKKDTKVEERESDSDDCISDSVLTFDSQEEQINVVYSAEDIKEFLRNAKWQKNVALEEFFPDRKQFIHDVKFFRREGAFVDVEIFRLKKLITRAVSGQGAQVVEDSFLVGLPKLSERAARELDRELSLEELHEALQRMENGRASGIDGLPAEFYKAFWAVIGQDVLDVLRDSIQRGELPLSCRRAVLTLLPKKGDLTHLKNWRPVSLLCTDYKLLSKALASRLTKVNWTKSEAILVGEWGGGQSTLPGGLAWKRGGFKYLGVYLGTNEFLNKNWEGSVEHVKGRLSRWKRLVPKMSYRGRTLVINNLAALSLWHKLACVDPPPNLLANIQAQLVDFFWDGLHWIPQSVLHLPKEEGGQGLVQLSSRAAAFRLQFIRDSSLDPET